MNLATGWVSVPTPTGAAGRIDALDARDPVGVAMRVEHVGGDLAWRPGDVGIDAYIDGHERLLVLAMPIICAGMGIQVMAKVETWMRSRPSRRREGARSCASSGIAR